MNENSTVEQANNVIVFPKYNPRAAVTVEQIHQEIDEARKQQCETIVDDIIAYMYTIMSHHNIELSTDYHMKNVALVVEALRGVTYGVYNFPHPLQSISQSIFQVGENSEGDMIINVVDELEEIEQPAK